MKRSTTHLQIKDYWRKISISAEQFAKYLVTHYWPQKQMDIRRVRETSYPLIVKKILMLLWFTVNPLWILMREDCGHKQTPKCN